MCFGFSVGLNSEHRTQNHKTEAIMKNLTILIFALLFTQLTVISQPRLNDSVGQACLPEGIIFSTQDEIDNFQTNYPNCNEIEGDVEISGGSITNLYGLNVLTAIEGDLQVFGNPSLTSLSGLENITTIGGDVEIGRYHAYGPYWGNPLLTSLTGLEYLTSIGGFLKVIGNENLLNLSGLENLSSIGGNLKIWGNDSLISLTGLENVTFVGEDLIIGH